MVRLRFACAVLVLSVGRCAFAQEPANTRLFPGSINSWSGVLSPNEPGNVTSTTTIDQGVTVLRRGSLFVLGFASISQRNDVAGYPWNNNTPLVIGGRVVKTWTFGVLQANAGLGLVARTPAAAPPVAPLGYLSFWSGWRNPRSEATRFAFAFPGHVWATSGVVTPLERNNWITNASGEEGVTVLHRRAFDVVTYGALTIFRDTQHYAWDNRTMLDEGVKIQRFISGGIVEVGVAERASRELTQPSQTGPIVFVNFWMGWDPRRP